MGACANCGTYLTAGIRTQMVPLPEHGKVVALKWCGECEDLFDEPGEDQRAAARRVRDGQLDDGELRADHAGERDHR